MYTAHFKLNGIMPLLMHHDNVEAADTLKEWQQDPSNKNVSVKGDDRSPAWTWQTYLYSDGQHVTMPADNIAVCLRQAGAKIPLKGTKTFKELTQSGMLITSEFCKFMLGGGQQIGVNSIDAFRDEPFKVHIASADHLGFRLFVKRATVNGKKHVRVRPRFDSWMVEGSVNVTANEITKEILTKIFELAGMVGLGDWRPGCKTPGPYGMFEAELKF